MANSNQNHHHAQGTMRQAHCAKRPAPGTRLQAPCCLVQFQSPVMAHARVTVRYALAAAAAAAAPSFADVGVVVWVGVVGVDVARVVASVCIRTK